MTLLETLSHSDTTTILLDYLSHSEIVHLVTCTRLFALLSDAMSKRREDISCGDSPHPVPCDSLQHGDEPSSESSRRGKWSLGGPLPPKFTFLNEAIYTFEDSGDPPFDDLEGCACFGECDDGDEDNIASCPCIQLNVAVQSGSAPLFECHSRCSCGTACRLRATQTGVKAKWKVPPLMRLRYMGEKGWGAYTVEAIPAGTFVAGYTGEVLPVHEARRRVPVYDRKGLNYVLTTQEFFQGGKQVYRTIIDATTSGNVSRFFNHCCDPTLTVFVIRRGSFLRPRLAFFTRNRVEAGSELTYDYGATGSAGGILPRGSDQQSSVQPQEPTRKTQRTSDADSHVESRPKGESPHRSGKLSSGDNLLQLDGNDDQRQAWVAGGPSSIRGDDARSPTLRRPCLCGSRRCRGVLPCNRVIL